MPTKTQSAAAEARKAERAARKNGAASKSSPGVPRPRASRSTPTPEEAAVMADRENKSKGAHAHWNLPKRRAHKNVPEPSSYSESEVKGWIQEFVATQGSTDYDAPARELPFVHNGRVYFKALPLIDFLAAARGIAPKAGPLAEALRDLGAQRGPFAFKLKGKQTGSSHYSLPKGRGWISLGDREKPEREPAAKKSPAKTTTKAAAKSTPRKTAGQKQRIPAGEIKVGDLVVGRGGKTNAVEEIQDGKTSRYITLKGAGRIRPRRTTKVTVVVA